MPLAGRIVKSEVMTKTDLELVQRDLTASHLEDEEADAAVDEFDAGAPALKAPEAKTAQLEAAPAIRAIAPSAELPAAPKSGKRRRLLPLALIAALGIGGYYGYYWWTQGRFFVSTDDAYVKADLSVISAKVSGNITAVPIKENIIVRPGDLLAQIDDRDYKVAVELRAQ